MDTNIILFDANTVTNGHEDEVIVIPNIVLTELDNKKSLQNELGYQAREFARIMSKAKFISVDTFDGLRVITLELFGKTILFAEKNTYITPAGLSSTNDSRIIEVAESLLAKGYETTFYTADSIAKITAMSRGLECRDYKLVENVDVEFIKYLDIPFEVFDKLEGKKIIDIDPEYEPQNFNYVFSSKDYTNQTKLAYVNTITGTLHVIDKAMETELGKQDIAPLNVEQKFFARALQDPSINVVVCEAKAGSGKTLLALSNAIRQVRLGKYSGITYVRHTIDDVPKEEEQGFLSGNDEKLAPFFTPLYDSLEYIVRCSPRAKKFKGKELEEFVAEGVDNLIKECNITMAGGKGLRGRTLHNEYIIMDEAQNPSAGSMQKALTRPGQGSKVVLIGSNRQIDNPYATKYNNGLSYILNACKSQDNEIVLYGIQLQKVVRSNIAAFAERIFSKKD